MAQGRIIDKSISLSEKVNLISDGASLLYTWMIPHSDDFGLLQGSALTIKALVAPMKPWTTEQVQGFLAEMVTVGLIKTGEYEGKQYYLILNGKQILKKDRQPQTILPFPKSKVVADNWKTGYSILETFGNIWKHLEDNVKHLDTEVKRREEKRRLLPKGNKVHSAPKPQFEEPLKEKKEPSSVVNHTLAEFKRVYGFFPTDKKPRFVAQNLIQRMKTITRERIGGEITDERLIKGITRYFNWLEDQDGMEHIQKLETAKLKLNIFMETLPRKEQSATN